jgi:NAD(P)-dependent dehydrogenase (short-subunit alcohol dehydrogenase family)
MAVDYGPSGIRVNAICPGTVPTPLVRKTYEEGGGFASTQTTPADFDEMMERNRGRYPIGKIGRPENIAMMAVYLASDESEWTTGTVIPVDGGMTAW